MNKKTDTVIIEYFSSSYPKLLKNINKPPSRLYARGNIKILNEPGIAVIGSRTNTQYGEKMCKRFVKNLVEYNINIISGLAIGIDSIAHQTCLKNSGKTIAVLPSGLDNIYPSSNNELANKILKNGGVLISEYENNIKADSKKFLERNRIVAGLGIGTLVVEGGNRSGTSVTARYTTDAEKPVFCIPSSLENIKGKVTNELIKKGAYLVTDVNDILNVYTNMNFKKRKLKKSDAYIDISNDLIDVYKSITDIPKDTNEIARVLGIPISEANYKTMMLQIEDKIIEIPGKGFIINEEN